MGGHISPAPHMMLLRLTKGGASTNEALTNELHFGIRGHKWGAGEIDPMRDCKFRIMLEECRKSWKIVKNVTIRKKKKISKYQQILDCKTFLKGFFLHHFWLYSTISFQLKLIVEQMFAATNHRRKKIARWVKTELKIGNISVKEVTSVFKKQKSGKYCVVS